MYLSNSFFYDWVSTLLCRILDEKHLYKAVRMVGARVEVNSQHTKEDSDSGVMQFIPRTWDWVAEKFDMPMWMKNFDLLWCPIWICRFISRYKRF